MTELRGPAPPSMVPGFAQVNHKWRSEWQGHLGLRMDYACDLPSRHQSSTQFAEWRADQLLFSASSQQLALAVLPPGFEIDPNDWHNAVVHACRQRSASRRRGRPCMLSRARCRDWQTRPAHILVQYASQASTIQTNLSVVLPFHYSE